MTTIVSLLDTVYPVGTVYMSVSSTSPGNLFGGSWEAITNKMILGSSSSYAVGSGGGNNHAVVISHNHTLGSHTHGVGHTHTCSHYHYLGDGSVSGIATRGTWQIDYSEVNGHGHTQNWYSWVANWGRSEGYWQSWGVALAGSTAWAEFSTGDASRNDSYANTTSESSVSTNGTYNPSGTSAGDGTNGNLPPYYGVYMWKRVS